MDKTVESGVREAVRKIEQRDPDASIDRPNWPALLHGHTRDFVDGMDDLVVVTRQSAKLGGQYIRKAMQEDYYHTSDAAGDELLDASHSCALTLSDVLKEAAPPSGVAQLVAHGMNGMEPNRPRKLEVAITREGRTLVGYSNETESGGFSLVGDITDQLSALSRTVSPASEDAIHNAAVRACMEKIVRRGGMYGGEPYLLDGLKSLLRQEKETI